MIEVEYTDEFERWWESLTIGEQEEVAVVIKLLASRGIALGYPYSSKINNAKVEHLRELRIQHKGHPYRVLYAFDPRRMAILLIGGNKAGDAVWYERFIPIAEKLYFEHLKEIKEEK